MVCEERRPRVLMAISPRAVDRVGRILRGFTLERAATLGELTHAMRRPSFDLVVVGSRFDGSRAIEALKVVRSHAPHIALACVRPTPFCNPLGGATLEAFQVAVGELGANCFVDMLQFPDDDAGNARVRAIFERLMSVT
jgi:hypothetical protein